MRLAGHELVEQLLEYGVDLAFCVCGGRVTSRCWTGRTRLATGSRWFPGREYGADLVNPDFAEYARSFGALGERVRTPEEFAAALDRVRGHTAVIEIDLS